LKELASKNAFTTSDLSGGTITLSNIGNIGGTYLHPVLVTSEVCIGSIGRMQRLPRFETVFDHTTGEKKEIVVPKEILAVSWNADHRVIDGATLARFVQRFKDILEHPSIMISRMR
jgi:2-oxoisovalerate dehydrogenase E2 component (dihydrolipoyl transacylase)